MNNPAAPVTVALTVSQNSPNPFNPSTDIRYTLRRDSRVTVTILTPAGRQVATLVDDEQVVGVHSVRWDGRDRLGQQAASGVYFCRLVAGSFMETRKMMLVK